MHGFNILIDLGGLSSELLTPFVLFFTEEVSSCDLIYKFKCQILAQWVIIKITVIHVHKKSLFML